MLAVRKLSIFLFFCIFIGLTSVFLFIKTKNNEITLITRSDHATEHRTSLGEYPGRFAIISYCSCNAVGCYLYEQSNRLKDEYCKLHGCKHLTFSFEPHLPSEGFKDHKKVATSIAAMWALINVTKTVLNSGDFDWVFPTGGDQVIWRFDTPPRDLLPASANGGKQYDVALVVEPEMKTAGLNAPPIIQNTEGGREFVNRWYSYSSKGNYMVEDQGVMNILLLRKIVMETSLLQERRDSMVQRYLNATACPVNIPMAVYDYQIEIGLPKYVEQSNAYAKCVDIGLQRFYGPRPWTSTSRGAILSRVLLYHRGSGPDEGMDWNSREPDDVNFMRHFSGVSKQDVPKGIQDTLKKFPKIDLSTPSAEFNRCVRPLMKG